MRAALVLVRLCCLLPGCLGLAGCGSEAAEAPAGERLAVPDFEIVTDVRQTMLWILEPAAERVWDAAGFVITAEGERDLSPTTEAGWEQVRAGAALVAETGNLLRMPGRTRGEDWDAYARAMIAASRGVMAAAAERDAPALFDAGGVLYETCRACHDRYPIASSPAPDAL